MLRPRILSRAGYKPEYERFFGPSQPIRAVEHLLRLQHLLSSQAERLLLLGLLLLLRSIHLTILPVQAEQSRIRAEHRRLYIINRLLMLLNRL